MDRMAGLAERYRRATVRCAKASGVQVRREDLFVAAAEAAMRVLQDFETRGKAGLLRDFNGDYAVYRQGCLARKEVSQSYSSWTYSRQLDAMELLAKERLAAMMA